MNESIRELQSKYASSKDCYIINAAALDDAHYMFLFVEIISLLTCSDA